MIIVPKFKEPEVKVYFISNCFEVIVSYFWSIEEAGKVATRLCSYISSTSMSVLSTVILYYFLSVWTDS